MGNKQEFQNWLQSKNYSQKNINAYLEALENIGALLDCKLNEPIWFVDDPEQAKRILRPLQDSPNFLRVNDEHNGTLDNAFETFIEF